MASWSKWIPRSALRRECAPDATVSHTPRGTSTASHAASPAKGILLQEPKDPEEMVLKALLHGTQLLVFALAVFDLIMTYAFTNRSCVP